MSEKEGKFEGRRGGERDIHRESESKGKRKQQGDGQKWGTGKK